MIFSFMAGYKILEKVSKHDDLYHRVIMKYSRMHLIKWYIKRDVRVGVTKRKIALASISLPAISAIS